MRVPAEVYLVLRPHGGQGDWTTFLHELGHALHFAHMRPDLPMEYRWLGDNSITEAYAMLFDHRMQDAGWLSRYTELGKPRVPEFLRGCLAVCCLEQDFPIGIHAPIIPREVLMSGTCLVGSTEVIRKLPSYERLPHGYGCVAIEDVLQTRWFERERRQTLQRIAGQRRAKAVGRT